MLKSTLMPAPPERTHQARGSCSILLAVLTGLALQISAEPVHAQAKAHAVQPPAHQLAP